jgi:hypothetical protein
MSFRPERAYLSEAGPQSHVPNKDIAIRATPDEIGWSPMSILRAIGNPPGLAQIEARPSKCLLARVFLTVAAFGTGLGSLSFVMMIAGLFFAAQGDTEGLLIVVQSFVGAGVSVGIVILAYGFAQHFSHVAKTRECMDRLCMLMERREGE